MWEEGCAVLYGTQWIYASARVGVCRLMYRPETMRTRKRRRGPERRWIQQSEKKEAKERCGVEGNERSGTERELKLVNAMDSEKDRQLNSGKSSVVEKEVRDKRKCDKWKGK